jgi:DNA uptake protein ComE-like DNA-binding protein
MAAKKIDLNKADFDDLASLRMVGETRAQFIIDHRPYHNWDELKQVPGLSEKMVDDIKRSGATID